MLQLFANRCVELVDMMLLRALEIRASTPRALDGALQTKRSGPRKRKMIRAPASAHHDGVRLGVDDVREDVSADDDVVVDRALVLEQSRDAGYVAPLRAGRSRRCRIHAVARPDEGLKREAAFRKVLSNHRARARIRQLRIEVAENHVIGASGVEYATKTVDIRARAVDVPR